MFALRIKALNSYDVSLGVGLIFVAILAICSIWVAGMPFFQQVGFSALTLAIVFGMVIGNTIFLHVAEHVSLGVDFSKNKILRLGIILYGFRITFNQIMSVGLSGFLIDIVMIGVIFTLSVQIGVRIFKLDRHLSMLIGAGSAICGAAAVIATAPLLHAKADKVSIAVATVVVFGTLSMFIYPVLYPYLGLSTKAYGLFVGSTIHEVAQVVAAGKSVSDSVASVAVIEKMLRVMMLAPFLFILAQLEKKTVAISENQAGHSRLMIPWFAVLFILVSVFNSFHIIPDAIIVYLIHIDTFLLAMAMAALGLRTHVSVVRHAGVKPLILAAILFIFLSIGGYGINVLVGKLFQI